MLLRRFDFSAALLRFSTICQNHFDSKYRGFVKGSPEKIYELCNHSSLPSNYEEVMQDYTKEGYRVIALATKELEGMTADRVHIVSRGEVESGLTFLGFLIMENKLKKETNAIIKELNLCKIRTLMATGDNVLTAISVARQCSIIHLEKEVWFGDLATKPDS